MMTTKTCPNCEKPMEPYVNYCSWECGVELAKKAGGKVFAPNGLPVRCIRHDGNMYEHEHGGHPDYKFPVKIEFQGEVTDDYRKDFEMMRGRPAKDDAEVRDMNGQTHALIYTDGSVAITMYECCYAMWYVRDGEFGGGSLWEKKQWRLSVESLEKVKTLAAG